MNLFEGKLFKYYIIKRMDSKTCSMCRVGKHIKDFYKNYTECKSRNSKRGLKPYFENKDKISNQ